MLPPRSTFVATATGEAEQALAILTTRERIAFAEKLVLGITDPRAAFAMKAASGRISDHAEALMPKTFQKECG